MFERFGHEGSASEASTAPPAEDRAKAGPLDRRRCRANGILEQDRWSVGAVGGRGAAVGGRRCVRRS